MIHRSLTNGMFLALTPVTIKSDYLLRIKEWRNKALGLIVLLCEEILRKLALICIKLFRTP